MEKEMKFLCNLTLNGIQQASADLHHKNKTITSIYIKNTKEEAIRVVKDSYHDVTKAPKYKITSKRPTDDPSIRYEDEHEISEATFNIFANSHYPRVIKDRYHILYEHFEWEIDVFEDYDFIIAEIEVHIDEDFGNVEIPVWVTKDVTSDPFYLNCNLAK